MMLRSGQRRGAFDLFIGDEVQQYKSGDSAQGQAFANFAVVSRKVLCLTGTLMGGYVTNLFYLLWRTNPHRMKDVTGSYKSVQRFSERYGVLEEIIKEPLSDNSNSIGGKRTVTVRERPGISPLVFTDLLLEQSVFMRLSDISANLPPYTEHVVSVEMTTEQSEAYTEFEDTLRKEVRQALARGDRSLLGAMLQSLLAYPDGARRGETITHPRHLMPDGSRVRVASAPRLDIDLLPKEEKLLEILRREKSCGRKVLLYLEHTGTRDLIPDLTERIGQSGLSSLVLRQNTTSAENRETWVKSRLSEGAYDLLVCNARLVETGLDLIEFPAPIGLFLGCTDILGFVEENFLASPGALVAEACPGPDPGAGKLYRIRTIVPARGENGDTVGIVADESTGKAAIGLTEFEAETAFALSLVKKGTFSQRVITEVKAQMIRKSGLMEFWEPADIKEVGGLANLKAYITNRAKAFLPGNENLPKPKGILLVGIPGTGKSLSCKATASILGWPLIRLDIGGLKNSLIGESERRMREATRVIEAFGEGVIWLDEVEKAFAGAQSSGQTDAGTTASMFGHFLTWMQETKSPILVMATANNIAQLPPEFLRAGRFDSIFFEEISSLRDWAKTRARMANSPEPDAKEIRKIRTA